MPTQIDIFAEGVIVRPVLPRGCSWECLLAMIKHGAELRVNHRLKGYFAYTVREEGEDIWADLRRTYLAASGYPDTRIRHWMKQDGWESHMCNVIVEAPDTVYAEAWRQAEEAGAGLSEIDWRPTILMPEDAYAR